MSSGYVLRVVHRDGTENELASPTVGIFTSAVAVGELVSPGQVVGAIEVLRVKHALRAPDGVAGRVMSNIGEGRTRVPVQYGDALFTISMGSEIDVTTSAPEGAAALEADLSFVAPMSGRFYSRPTPTEAPFVNPGDTVRRGQTIGLLEVMKTFNRLVYQGDGLPEVAVVDAIAPADGDDVVRGEVILALSTP